MNGQLAWQENQGQDAGIHVNYAAQVEYHQNVQQGYVNKQEDRGFVQKVTDGLSYTWKTVTF